MSTKSPSPPDEFDPMAAFVSSRLIVAANLLRRGAARRYARLLRLSSVEFGIVAMLGGRSPTPVRTLAALLGIDKAQLSRALSALTRRGVIDRTPGPSDQRDVLVSLAAPGRAMTATIFGNAERVNERLQEGWSRDEVQAFDTLLARVTVRARALLAEEAEAGGEEAGPGGASG